MKPLNEPRWWNPLPIITFGRDMIEDYIGKKLTDKEWWLYTEFLLEKTFRLNESLIDAKEKDDWDLLMSELEILVETFNPKDEPVYNYDITDKKN